MASDFSAVSRSDRLRKRKIKGKNKLIRSSVLAMAVVILVNFSLAFLFVASPNITWGRLCQLVNAMAGKTSNAGRDYLAGCFLLPPDTIAAAEAAVKNAYGKAKDQTGAANTGGGQVNLSLATNQPALSKAKKIEINLPSRRLRYFEGDKVVKEYPVAVGRPDTPTPLGEFVIKYKEVNPCWYPPGTGTMIRSGPQNPLGYRWLEFAPLYGIHGTNQPEQIGRAVSNGCVRMREENVEELFELVPPGLPVYITYKVTEIKINDDGQVVIGIYPDIYGYRDRGARYEELIGCLAKYNLSDFISNETLRQLSFDGREKSLAVARLFKVKINNEYIEAKAVKINNSLLVPVWAVAAKLNLAISGDAGPGRVVSYRGVATAVDKNDILYVTPAGIQQLFGGMWRENQAAGSLEFIVPTFCLK